MTIELSLEEARAVAKLRRQGHSWRSLRWVFLVVGVLTIAASPILAHNLLATLDEYAAAEPKAIAFGLHLAAMTSYGMVIAFFLGMFGVVVLAFCVARWRGRPDTTVLLALVERQTAATDREGS